MSKFVYQLVAVGNSACFSEKFEVRTKTVFTTEQKAIDRIPKFKAICLDKSRFNYAEEKGLEITVFPLEIVE